MNNYTLSEVSKLWENALDKINERLGEKQIFDSFFVDTYIDEIQGDTIKIVVNSSLAAMLLQNKYYDIISEIITDITETNFKLTFICKDDLKEKEQPVSIKRVSYFKDSFINPQFTFSNFIVGSFNREASQAALLVASNPGKTFINPLFLHSNSGLGKTHLMNAIANYIKDNNPASKILYVSTNDFIDEFIKYCRGEKDAESLKDFICGYDVFLLDDVQFLSNRLTAQQLLFTVYEKLINAGKQIVITSDRQPNEIKDLEDRLVTRFNKGLIVKIGEPDKDTCVEILRKKISESGFKNPIDDAVLYFFADKFSKDIRELQGALNQLMFAAVNMNSQDHITMEVASQAVGFLISSKSLNSQLTEQRIINEVADYYNLTPGQLTGKVRTGQLALARHIAMHIIRYSLDVSLERIGDIFGGKHHTTVMSAIQKVDELLKTDEGVKQAIADIKKRLKIK